MFAEIKERGTGAGSSCAGKRKERRKMNPAVEKKKLWEVLGNRKIHYIPQREKNSHIPPARKICKLPDGEESWGGRGEVRSARGKSGSGCGT